MRHDPQRFLSKSVPHFNRETVEYAFRERNESNPGIKILLPFLKKITEESDLENFEDLIVALDACYWLHKAISIVAIRLVCAFIEVSAVYGFCYKPDLTVQNPV